MVMSIGSIPFQPAHSFGSNVNFNITPMQGPQYQAAQANALNAMAKIPTLGSQIQAQNALNTAQAQYAMSNAAAQNALAKTKAQYAAPQAQAALDYQNTMTDMLPMSTKAKYLQSLGIYGRSLAYGLGQQQLYSPTTDQYGNAPGAYTASGSLNNFLATDPSLSSNYQGAVPQMGGAPQPMTSPQMPQSMGSPQMPQVQQPQQQFVQPQGGMLIKNRITGTYTDANGNIIQPSTVANRTADQATLSGLQRVPDLLDTIDKIGFMTTGNGQWNYALNKTKTFGGSNQNYPDVNAVNNANEAIQQVGESLAKTFGVHPTDQNITRLTDSLEPKLGEGTLQYQNRVQATKYRFMDYAQQAAQRLKSGYTLGASDLSDAMSSDPTIAGVKLSDIQNTANAERVPLDTIVKNLQMLQAQGGK